MNAQELITELEIIADSTCICKFCGSIESKCSCCGIPHKVTDWKSSSTNEILKEAINAIRSFNETLNFIQEFFDLLKKYDAEEYLMWNTEEGKLKLLLVCSDLFFWGSADAEPVTPETLNELKKSFEDVASISPDADYYGAELYCARRRKMRPQGAAYPEDKALFPLFNACGEKRETGLGNPCRPGEYKRGR